MNRLSITVDIEDWYHKTFLQAKSFTKKTFIEKWDGKYDYLSLREPTRRVLDLLDEFDIKATFFVDVVDHYPGLVESIVERGHEIGCHGLHQKLTFVNSIDTD